VFPPRSVDIEYVQDAIGSQTAGDQFLAVLGKAKHRRGFHFVQSVVGAVGGPDAPVVGVVQMNGGVAAHAQETARGRIGRFHVRVPGVGSHRFSAVAGDCGFPIFVVVVVVVVMIIVVAVVLMIILVWRVIELESIRPGCQEARTIGRKLASPRNAR